ncbi:methyl-accepting chemotaxis protein [Hydrogenophaga palleronii]|uniref:Methyl-accepting chemotaxis protein n=1 Tax=Hydrogenophaga palleronii TaxID=65655 RepID=A0ABU1WVK6_9BURK|nr:methyl-accepting chemotaxis protein [Hydrogenophaga palleronii]MDR7153037.1 methyl-accepting chemotaxis protein [Hydrogenophaga palleronii]
MTSLATLSPLTLHPHTPHHIANLSLVNIAARQRMLSQRMILQTVMAANGDAEWLRAAHGSLLIFTESQQHLDATIKKLEPASAQKLTDTYDGPNGVGPVVQAFMRLMRSTLDQIEAGSPRVPATIAELVGHTDRILAALNTATTAFDEVSQAGSDAMMKELAGIVDDIQGVAKEAKVVSFNAQVMAARAGQHGREFAVVANVLSDITGEIDRLTRKAAVLAERSRRR